MNLITKISQYKVCKNGITGRYYNVTIGNESITSVFARNEAEAITEAKQMLTYFFTLTTLETIVKNSKN